MWQLAHRKAVAPLRSTLLVVMAASISVGCMASVMHDEVATSPPAPGTEMKWCTCAPCGVPCGNPSPPPPSLPPPSPSPPPPSPVLPPPTPTLPPPYNPWSPNCPPPPPQPPFYPWGPPTSLYPLDPNYRPSGGCRSKFGWLKIFVVCGLLSLWQFWWW